MQNTLYALRINEVKKLDQHGDTIWSKNIDHYKLLELSFDKKYLLKKRKLVGQFNTYFYAVPDDPSQLKDPVNWNPEKVPHRIVPLRTPLLNTTKESTSVVYHYRDSKGKIIVSKKMKKNTTLEFVKTTTKLGSKYGWKCLYFQKTPFYNNIVVPYREQYFIDNYYYDAAPLRQAEEEGKRLEKQMRKK